MARKRPDGQPTAVLTHPNDSDIKFTVRKPTRNEQFHRREKVQQFQKALQLYDDNGKPIIDEKSGERSFVLQQNLPTEELLNGMRLIVKKVEGTGLSLEDSIPELLEEWLDVEIEEPIKDAKDGEPKTKKVRMDAATWISRQISKPETFDADPLASVSAPQ